MPAAALQGRKRLAGAFLIEIGRIRPDPNQPRKMLDAEAQFQLTRSILAVGVLQPITVRYIEDGDFYQIIAGQCRYQASVAAELTEIPCWIQDPKSEDILLHQIVENWQRSDLHPFELADALARLRDARHVTQKELARFTGKSEGEIAKLLAMLDLEPEAQKLAREDKSGNLSRRHLYAATRLPPEQQLAFLTRITLEKITADEAEQEAAASRPAPRTSLKRGAPVTQVRFLVPDATVLVTFRKKDITLEAILAALDEARRQASEPKSTLNIVRPK